MGSLVAAVASSHAFAVTPPEKWDELRERNRNVYAQRQHIAVPLPHPRISAESVDDVHTRYAHVRDGLFELKRIIEDSKPHALIVIGDDQNENFTAQNVPQLAIYTGAEAVFFDRLSKEERTYRCDAEIARIILNSAVEGGFDLSFSESFPDKRLISHAHVEPLMPHIAAQCRCVDRTDLCERNSSARPSACSLLCLRTDAWRYYPQPTR